MKGVCVLVFLAGTACLSVLVPVKSLDAWWDCGGGCSGNSVKQGTLPGTCPAPCPTPALWQAAKSEARNNANRLCQQIAQNEDCLCTNGSYQTNTATCATVNDPELGTVCEYVLDVSYMGGTCAIVH